MTFGEILEDLRNYKPCRRNYWALNNYIRRQKYMEYMVETKPSLTLVKINGNDSYVISNQFTLTTTDIFANDWEVLN